MAGTLKALAPVLVSLFIPLAAAAAPAMPALDDPSAIGSFLKAADADARLRFYEAFFRDAAFSFATMSAVDTAFEKDFDAAKPDRRSSMAKWAIAAARRPERVKAKGSDGTLAYRTLDMWDFEFIFAKIAQYEEGAALYYAALPFPAHSTGRLDQVSMEGKRPALLLALLPALGPAMSAAGKALVRAEALKWPLRLKDKAFDAESMRKVAAALCDPTLPFFHSARAAAGIIAKADAKALAAAKPTEAELAEFAAGLCGLKDYEGADRIVTMLAPPDAATLKAARPWIDQLAKSADPRAQAAFALVDALKTAPAPAKAADYLARARASKDDWAAFCLYRAAALGKAAPADADIPSWLDPSRPSLAAAALEDRFGKAWLAAEGYLYEALPPGAEPDSALKSAIAKKLLSFKPAAEARVALPIAHAMVWAASSDSLVAVCLFSRSPNFGVRRTAFAGMLRYASTAMYSYFLAGLGDPSDDIRTLAIDGLGAIRDSRAVEALARILEDQQEREYVRIAAARALGLIGDRRLVQIYKGILLLPPAKGEGDGARIMAARELGEAKERTAADALLANIDPTRESELNYYCLEALGKMEAAGAYARLLAAAEKGFEAWAAGKASLDNLYAALWALFTWKESAADKFRSRAFERFKAAYEPAAYIAAWGLARGADKPDPARTAYLDAHWKEFFGAYNRVYEFARILKGKWDAPNLGRAASLLGELDDATRTWVLSGIDAQPSLAYAPFLAAALPTGSDSVRAWLAGDAALLAGMLGKAEPGEAAAAAGELRALVEAWPAGEADSRVLAWLALARTRLDAYDKATAAAGAEGAAGSAGSE